MNYEWDEKKNKSNIMKHGLDFHDAILVFESPMIITEDKRNEYSEARLRFLDEGFSINEYFYEREFYEDNFQN